MVTAGPESSREKPLRLWPGVAGAIIVVVGRFVIAPFVPGGGLIGVLAGIGRCRAHPSLVALLQPRSVVGKDRRGPADRAGRRHDAALRTSVDRRRGVEGCCSCSCFPRPSRHSWSRGPSCRGDPRAAARWATMAAAILLGSWRVGPRAHRRNQGGGQPAARVAMDADRGGATADRGPRRNAAPCRAGANSAHTSRCHRPQETRLPPRRSRDSAGNPGPPNTGKPPVAAPAVAPILWSGFRGQERNAVVDGARINTDWNAAKPAQVWRRTDRAGMVVVRRRRRADLHAGAARRPRGDLRLQPQHRRTSVASPGRGAILRAGWQAPDRAEHRRYTTAVSMRWARPAS